LIRGNTMLRLPTLDTILSIFREETALLGGEEYQPFQDGDILIVRSIFSLESDVRPGDTIRAGLGLFASETDIQVYPYTFREVCKNGAVSANTMACHQLLRQETWQADTGEQRDCDIERELREVIKQMAEPALFHEWINNMKASTNFMADLVLMLLPAFDEMDIPPKHLIDLIRRFYDGDDQSGYGLMNSVTSVARDEPDPENRWKLESIGGQIPAWLLKATPAKQAAVPNEVVEQLICT